MSSPEQRATRRNNGASTASLRHQEVEEATTSDVFYQVYRQQTSSWTTIGHRRKRPAGSAADLPLGHQRAVARSERAPAMCHASIRSPPARPRISCLWKESFMHLRTASVAGGPRTVVAACAFVVLC